MELPTGISFDRFFDAVNNTSLASWVESIRQNLNEALSFEKNGHLTTWIEALNILPNNCNVPCTVSEGRVVAGTNIAESEVAIEQTLRAFVPWRKGPWEICGIHIDSEWHSDWKWERVAPHLSNLQGRTILDVGCGNGYYAYRMALSGAARVVGIDPGMLAVMQAQIIARLLPQYPVWILPLGIEDLPQELPVFDTVFSMGILYHRKSPIDHLLHLKQLLRPGGELVLETIVIPEEFGHTLLPEDRYAKMRNVWFIPSVPELHRWLTRCGFHDVICVDCSITDITEQRSTSWMHFESLCDFLDPNDASRTIEGYPAPQRAVFIAQKPNLPTRVRGVHKKSET